MAVDLVPDSGAKKVKTKKSKEQKAAEREQLKAEAQAVIVDAGGDVQVEVKDKKSKKRRAEANGEGEEEGERKKKKRKEKEEAAAEQTEEAGEDSEKKKKKKKRKHAEAEAETATVAVECEDFAFATESDKKSKKRKQEQEANAEPSSSIPKTEKHKDKKKKDKKDAAAASVSSASAALAPPATSSEAAAFLTEHSITIHTPEGQEALSPILKFEQLAIPSELRSCFKGFSAPTPIQACTWPPALLGRDVVGIAETGSGKTLAFGIPALARLITSPRPNDGSSTISVLVVAPTRELALQTHDTLSALGGPLGIASVAVFGGVPKEPQVRMLRNLNKGKDGLTTRVVVGTPGRILDLVQDGVCDLSQVNYLVLDEADRMLDKGFENDIRNIISNTKQGVERQTMMFSATWPDAVRRLASTFQQDPVRVTVGSDDLTANSRVEQVVEVFDDGRSKDNRLLGHLRALGHKKTTKTGEDEARILVFALYKKEASRVEQRLRQEGYSVGALHGDLSQSARMEALERFKNGTTGLLVATDVAARGLDIPNVGAVINYTFPLTIEDYIHRIGRTGRGGKTGKSITFFTGDAHERSLAGELARVLRESGFQCEGLKKFPMTIKKKEHGVYGAFFRDDITKKATKIVFD
ncbi:P-loop containing nucleoside triphosphate hydrolase protein [Mycena albidolilacea]|uniref:RNA helicase n=1 Tax=Mycena albidolilacea TaxID=1033008 RepID=A0AAD7AEE6_9AGAR|nr:P-loop containing nucleoside triphosphate hydrolase protein [Mycena albidolilacea]